MGPRLNLVDSRAISTPLAEGPSGVEKSIERALRGCSRSERAQQDRADERKHREHRQHVKPQRKIHVTSSRFVRDASLTEG